MPGRYYGKKKRYSRYQKKDPFYRFSKGDSLAIKALKMAANVKKALNVEYKSHNRYTTATITNAATWANTQMFCLNEIAQGDSGITHDGDTYKIVGISNKLGLTCDVTNGYARVRVMFFRFKNPQGALPAQADLLDTTASNPPLEFRNLDNVRSYEILHDRVYEVNNLASDDQATQYHTINIDREFKVRCSGVTASYASISENSIWCMIVSDRGANQPTFQMNTRVRFVDN